MATFKCYWCYDLISMEKVCVTLHDSWNSIGPHKIHAPISSILMKPRDMNSLTLLDALCPMADILHGIKYTGSCSYSKCKECILHSSVCVGSRSEYPTAGMPNSKFPVGYSQR